jgi:hypothetical protein
MCAILHTNDAKPCPEREFDATQAMYASFRANHGLHTAMHLDDGLARHSNPFARVYLVEADGTGARLAGKAGVDQCQDLGPEFCPHSTPRR